ncbi:universal stress protein [Phenylobacterium sp.]|uniref:universal stress protein n=1 Tax=Phenylobacterium sp. TaxID=1871053 RepID=UPI0035B37066
MDWTCILAPLSGGGADPRTLAVARALAEPFSATVSAAYTSTPASELITWVNEAGVSTTALAIGELEQATRVGEANARTALARLDYRYKSFDNVTGDDWLGLRIASRLADVVVWPPRAARSRGFFSHAFQQVLIDEQRPALIADHVPPPDAPAAIAWDGGREAARAVRRAMPWLRRSRQVTVLTVPYAVRERCETGRLLNYLADCGVAADASTLHGRSPAGPLLLAEARRLGAAMLVAGAFGHPRLQRFIFGGTTQTLLEDASDLALFLSH